MPTENTLSDQSYFIAAAAFYRQWGCGYKAHKAFKEANAYKLELTPVQSRPATPRRRSSYSNSGTSVHDSVLITAEDYEVTRLDLRSGLQYAYLPLISTNEKDGSRHV